MNKNVIENLNDVDDLDLDLDSDGVNEITDTATINPTDVDDLDLGEDTPEADELVLDEGIDDLKLEDVSQPPVVDKTTPVLNKPPVANLDDEIDLDLDINNGPTTSVTPTATSTETASVTSQPEKVKATRTRKPKATPVQTGRVVDYVQDYDVTSLDLLKYKTRITERPKEAIQELASKILEQGQIEPIHVFVKDGVSYLLGGFGRVDAIKLNGGKTAKAFVYTGISDAEIYKICSGSNEPRTELTEWDKIVSIGKYSDATGAPVFEEGNPNSVARIFVYSRSSIYNYLAAWEFFKTRPTFLEFFKVNGASIAGYVYPILQKVIKDSEHYNIADDVWLSILSGVLATTNKSHLASELIDAAESYAKKASASAAIAASLNVPMTPLDAESNRLMETAASGVKMEDVIDLETEIVKTLTTKEVVDNGFETVLIKLTQAISGMDALIVIDGYNENKNTEKIIAIKQAIKKSAESAKLL